MDDEGKENLKHRVHTTLYNNFFVLRTEVIINGQCAVVEADEKGWLTLNCRYPQVGMTFDSLMTNVNEVLQSYGMKDATKYYCGEVPLFKVNVSSKDDLKRLLSLQRKIRRDLTARIACVITELQSPDNNAPAPSLSVQVESQVFLLIPNPATKDGKIIQVTRDNIASCMALFRESEVFNFGALFRAFRTNPTMEDKGPKDLQQLLCELHQVVGWYHLGLHLGVPAFQLKIIANDHSQETVQCRTEMLFYWMNNTVEKKWATIVQALVRTGERALASTIALNYGVPDPSASRDERTAMLQGTCPGCCSSTLHRLGVERFDVEGKDKELQQQNQSLKQAVRKRVGIAEKFTTLGKLIQEAKSKVTQLLQKRSELEAFLEIKEHQLQLMNQSATKEKEIQQRLVVFQEREIRDLKEELAAVKDELEKQPSQISAMEKELQKVTVELAKQSTEIRVLREAKEDLMSLLTSKRRRIDDCLQQQRATSSGREVEVHHPKEAAEMKSRDVKALQETLEKKDEEMKALLKQNADLEAQLEQLLHPITTQATDEHHLQECMDTWHNLAHSEECLLDAEEEGPSDVSMCEEDGSKTHAATVAGESRVDPVKLSFQWNTRMSAPQRMYRGAAVSHGNTIYVIGYGLHKVYSYRLDTNVWNHDELAPCPHTKPGLVIINSLLTAVGGLDRGRLTRKLVSWKHGGWREEFPPMQTPRKEPGLISSDTHIIAVGGDRKGRKVEVLHVPSQVWSKVTSLPTPLYYITATLCHDDIIAVGRYGFAYKVSMNALISKPTQWTALEQCRRWSTLTTFRGRTLLVHYTGIYELQGKKWERIGNMAVPKALPLVCVARDQIVVVGGCDRFLPTNIGGLDLNTTTTTVRVATIV